jgi:hypothetical protein
MFPPPLVEWAVLANLDKQREPEMILLKGHLYVELFLKERLRIRHSYNRKILGGLSFYRMLTLVESDIAETDEVLKSALNLARKLNLLRNAVAHEALFDSEKAGLYQWASEALRTLPSTKPQKHTRRNRLIYAIAALAKILYALNEKDQEASGTSSARKPA